jgi:hypothetical protein
VVGEAGEASAIEPQSLKDASGALRMFSEGRKGLGDERMGVELAGARTTEKPPDRPVLVRERRARSERRFHHEHRLLLRKLSARLSTDRSTP